MRCHASLIPGLSLMLLATLSLAEDPFARWEHFSATRTGGAVVRDPIKMYRSGNLIRADHENQIHITNLKELSNVVLSDHKCILIPLSDGPVYPFDAGSVYGDFKLERAMLEGEEVVDGHHTKIETLNYTQNGNPDVYIKMKLWEAQDLQGFPIKIEVLPYIRKKPFTIQYSDVSMEAPDAALFKMPANCRKMTGAIQTPPLKVAPVQTTKPPSNIPPKAAPPPQ